MPPITEAPLAPASAAGREVLAGETGSARVLAQVTLGYTPMIDRDRQVIATRLNVAPLQRDEPLDAAGLLAAVSAVWPLGAGRVALNLISEPGVLALLAADCPPNLMLEVPAFMAGDTEIAEAIVAAHLRGTTLLLRGRPRSELARSLLPCFKHAVIDIEEERRRVGPAPEGVARRITHIQSGVTTLAEMQASFERGAVAVLGWPIDEAARAGADEPAWCPDAGVVRDLLEALQEGESPRLIELMLLRDPALAYDLLRHTFAPARSLGVEGVSVREAIEQLGPAGLQTWLARWLVAPAASPDRRPALFAAHRRGLILQALARAGVAAGNDDLADEAFLCGAFSLLDRLCGAGLTELLDAAPLPESVRQALIEGGGPWRTPLDVACALEGEAMFDIREHAERALIGQAELNRALLGALAQAARGH